MKQCLYCEKEMMKPKKYSYLQWGVQVFCSRRCSGKANGFKKGHKEGRRYEKGATPWNKGKETGLTPWNKGLKFPNLSKENSHRWKGGKIIRGGYVLIRIPEHPNSIMGGYVAEHRLVMEKYLGRYLEFGEVVHHVNEDRVDNRIENLKLYRNSGHHVCSEHAKRDGSGRFVNLTI